MVISFQVQQRILPDFVKSSDISIPMAMRDIDLSIATLQEEAPDLRGIEAEAVAENIRARAHELLALELVYLHRAER